MKLLIHIIKRWSVCSGPSPTSHDAAVMISSMHTSRYRGTRNGKKKTKQKKEEKTE
jgi:hypothetical protein